jgi:hypothetical protein
MEVGRYQHGFHCRITPHAPEALFHLGNSGPADQDCPVHTAYSAERYAEIYIDLVVRLHGVPKTILSDHGTQFVARFWEQVHESMGTKLIHSSSYHPWTDGQTERVNEIVEDMLRACVIHLTNLGTNA